MRHLQSAVAADVGEHAMAVKPNDVPHLLQPERVYIEDPATPAPGADAFRWFFYASSPPWTNTRHSLSGVRALQKEFLVKLRNVYSFFTIYATIDGFSPAEGNLAATATTPAALAASTGYRPAKDRSLLDRWMLSELALATRQVTENLVGNIPAMGRDMQALMQRLDALEKKLSELESK